MNERINHFRILVLLVLMLPCMQALSAISSASSLHIPFIKNQGQLKQSEVAYYASTFGGTLFVKQTGEWIYNLPKQGSSQSWAFQERLLGAKQTAPTAKNPSSGKINYFKGKKQQWRTNLSSYSDVAFENIYPGINLSLQAHGNDIEKIFTVSPNSNPAKIQLYIDGVNRLSTNDQKQLVLDTQIGQITFSAPIAYQFIEGKKVNIEVAYRVNDHQYGFKLGNYDKDKTLIIDPLLASTFIGGNNDNAISDFEQVHGIVEQNGFVFIAGMTDSSNFPTTLGSSNNYNGGYYDGYISKFDTTLSTLVASTFIGGSGGDDIWGMTLDGDGNVYVLGRAASGGGFPLTAGGYRYNTTVTGGTFVAKFNNDLSTLLATALATGNSLPGEITVANNSVYISGKTNSPNLPATSDAYDTTCGSDGNCDPSGSYGITKYYGYAERLSINLDSLIAATYLGESGGIDIAVGPNTQVYVISLARVTQTAIMSLDANLTTQMGLLTYPTNNGFSAIDMGDNYIVATGSSRDPNLPTTATAFDTGCGTDGLCDPTGPTNYLTADIFVGKYSLDLLTTHALTYFGGSKAEFAPHISVDSFGNIVVTGAVASSDMPTTNNAFDSTYNGNNDGFIAKFNPDLSILDYSSYIGGNASDIPQTVYVSDNGHAFVAGYTFSTDFPTTSGAFDQTYNGGDVDVFVSVFDVSGSGGTGGGTGDGGSGGGSDSGSNQAPIANAGSDQTVLSGETVFLDGSASVDADGEIVKYKWKQKSGRKVSLKKPESVSPYFTAKSADTLVFELLVIDNDDAKAKDRVTITVTK